MNFFPFSLKKVEKIRNNVQPGTRVDDEVKMIEVNVNNCCMDTFAPLKLNLMLKRSSNDFLVNRAT